MHATAAAVEPAPIAELPAESPAAPGLLAGFALATVLFHLVCLTRYGWFRDELYYIACGRHFAFGYVDQPPLSILLLRLSQALLGDSPQVQDGALRARGVTGDEERELELTHVRHGLSARLDFVDDRGAHATWGVR